ncbi:hypothetical protein [Aquimarina sp. 2304DJ70-9]|uniref:hypothetical protein n=1 Tax=Aquimarina penaris TaxID=3231044 RepID=UPI003462EF4F
MKNQIQKYITSCMVIILLFSCSGKKNQLLGAWSLESNFYRATYEIVEDDGKIKAKVLYYNDDTTAYQYDGQTPQYLFSDLKEKENRYIDAVSGATNTETNYPNIKVISQDSLEVTTYLVNKPLKEIWIRKINNKKIYE